MLNEVVEKAHELLDISSSVTNSSSSNFVIFLAFLSNLWKNKLIFVIILYNKEFRRKSKWELPKDV